MKDTFFYPAESYNPRIATLYSKTDKGLVKQNNPNFMNGAFFSGGGGIFTTAEDYLQFGLMLMNGGQLNGKRLLSPRTVELMRSPFIPDTLPGRARGESFGLSMRVVTDPIQRGVALSAGSFGWSGAYGTHFWVDPKEKLVAVMMTQTADGEARADFETAVMQAIVEPVKLKVNRRLQSHGVVPATLSLSIQLSDAVAAGHDHATSHARKNPRIHDAGHRLEFLLESRRVSGNLVSPIQNHVAVIGEEGPTIFLADSRTAELNQNARNGQRNHLNRNHALAAQPLHKLAFVHDNDDALRSVRDNFFANERAAQTFDEVQLGRHFIGAVHGDVDFGMFVESGERHAQFLRQAPAFI